MDHTKQGPVNSPVIPNIILQEKLPQDSTDKLPVVLSCLASPSGRILSYSRVLPPFLGGLFNKAVLINQQNE